MASLKFRAYLLVLTAASSLPAAEPYSAPFGIRSAHSDLVNAWVHQFPTHVAPRYTGLTLRCFETNQDGDVIGLVQGLTIDTPVSKLVAVLDDYPHYKDLFEDTVSVRAHPISNGLNVAWEQKAPIALVSNTKYSVNTVIHDELPIRKIWHSRLANSNQIKSMDSIVAVYSIDAAKSYYLEVDFVNAQWGLLSTFAMGRIWSESVKAMALADLAVKLRAENPNLSYARIHEAARVALPVKIVEQCTSARLKLDLRHPPAFTLP